MQRRSNLPQTSASAPLTRSTPITLTGGSTLQQWPCTPFSQAIASIYPNPTDLSETVATTGYITPADSIDQSLYNYFNYNQSISVGNRTQAWIAINSQTDEPPYTASKTTLKYLFWPSDYNAPLAATPSTTDEVGNLWVFAEEWDTSSPYSIRYFIVAWTPSTGFSFYGWLWRDWTNAYYDFSNLPQSNRYNYEYTPWNNLFYSTAGAVHTSWSIGNSSYDAPPNTFLEMASAGDATFAGIGPNTHGPNAFVPPYADTYPLVRRNDGNYVQLTPNNANPGTSFVYTASWVATEYTPDGNVVRTDTVVSFQAQDNQGGYNWITAQSTLAQSGTPYVFFPIMNVNTTTGNTTFSFVKYDYENRVVAETWTTTAVTAEPFAAYSGGFQVSPTRLVFPVRQNAQITVYYFNSDGTFGSYGTVSATAYNVVDATPTPDGTGLWALSYDRSTESNNFHYMTLASLPASLPAPSFTLPQSSYSFANDTIGQSILAELGYTEAQGRAPSSTRYYYLWTFGSIGRVKGSPVVTQTQGLPPSTGGDNTAWQNARVITGTSGSVAVDLSSAPATSGSGVAWSIDNKPTRWYRFDPEGRPGWLFYYLTNEPTTTAEWTYPEPDPFLPSNGDNPYGAWTDGTNVVIGGLTGNSASQGKITTSSDGGLTWRTLNEPNLTGGTYETWSAITAFSSSAGIDGIAVGTYPINQSVPSVVVVTTDQGATWSSPTQPLRAPANTTSTALQSLHAMTVGAKRLVWALGYGVPGVAWADFDKLAAGTGSWQFPYGFPFTAYYGNIYASVLGSHIAVIGGNTGATTEYFYLAYGDVSSGDGNNARWITLPIPIELQGATYSVQAGVNDILLAPGPNGGERLFLLGNVNDQGVTPAFAAVWYTDDQGVTWVRAKTEFASDFINFGNAPSGAFVDAHASGGGGKTLLAATQSGLVYSQDYGETWEMVAPQPFQDQLTSGSVNELGVFQTSVGIFALGYDSNTNHCVTYFKPGTTRQLGTASVQPPRARFVAFRSNLPTVSSSTPLTR